MGILDDLKSQAEQKNKPAGEQPISAGAEEFYLAQVKQRMVMANDFLTQLVNQLNEMKLVIKAEYPFRPEGKKVTLLQQGYKAYSDHITDPRQITLSFSCILANPATYDVRGQGPALAQSELLKRYQFKHEILEARDQNQMVSGARFKLQGPLQVKCVLQFDEARQHIKLMLTNFVGPGTSQYNLKPEQLNEAFMDHLGKYLLRKEAKLFQEEISDEAKAMLRRRLQQEQLQREAELRAIEEQRRAEEAARKQNSTTEQLKKAVTQSVAENREKLKKIMDEQVRDKGEKLKNMFNKLKNRTRNEAAPAQPAAPPAVNTRQTARPTGTPAGQGQAPADRRAGQTTPAPQNAARPKPVIEQRKPTPPRVFQSTASNPFLKPEDFEPVPRVTQEQAPAPADTQNPAAIMPAETATPTTTTAPTTPISPAAAQARSAADSRASAAKPVNPFLQTKAAAVRADMKKPAGRTPAQATTPVTPTIPPPAQPQARPTAESRVSAATPANPVLSTTRTADRAETKKPTGQSPAQMTRPVMPRPPVAPVAESGPVAVTDTSATNPGQPLPQTRPPAEPGLSLEPPVAEAESPVPATPAEPALSLEPPVAEAESLAPTTPAEPGLSLELPVAEAESAAPATPTEPALSLESPVAETESPALATPTEPALSLEPDTLGGDAASPAAKTDALQPEATADLPALSLEDELERDLARIMEKGLPQPSLERETPDDPSLTSDELDIDLSSPAALEIHFEETDRASDRKNSEPKK